MYPIALDTDLTGCAQQKGYGADSILFIDSANGSKYDYSACAIERVPYMNSNIVESPINLHVTSRHVEPI